MRVLEGVPDVQRAGDVRRRDDDAVRPRGLAASASEVAALYPALVAAGLYVGRRVLGRQLWRCHSDQF